VCRTRGQDSLRYAQDGARAVKSGDGVEKHRVGSLDTQSNIMSMLYCADSGRVMFDQSFRTTSRLKTRIGTNKKAVPG